MWFRLSLLFLSPPPPPNPPCSAQRENYAARRNLWTFNILCQIRQIFKMWTHLLGQSQLVLFNFSTQGRWRFGFLNGRRWLRWGGAASTAATRNGQMHARKTGSFSPFALLVICAGARVIVLGSFPERFSPACRTAKLLGGKHTLTRQEKNNNKNNYFHTCCCLLVASTLFICPNPPQPLLY